MAKSATKATSEVQKWLGIIKAYDTEFERWEKRVEKLLKRYRDERTTENRDNPQSRFNILWSNVQTLIPATFAKLPQPDVSRRFSDRDPVGRVAAMIIERSLDFEIQHYADYRQTMKQCVLDRFLGGRGTAWARYEPHIKAQSLSQPADGVTATEDTDSPNEELDYESAPVDYVHWKDFGHTVSRTWEEVTAGWRKVYMTREACVERFGEKIGEKIPLDASPEDLKRLERQNPELAEQKRAAVYEIWDKENDEALWLSKSQKTILDRKDDPLNLEGFFPFPKPLYATLTNDSLIPVPDFTLYQDQAAELDTLCDRIDGLIKSLQVKGVYDASQGIELARLFTDSDNTDLRPIKNWQAFAEKNGLKGAIDLVDLTPIANALEAAYLAMEQIKNQVHEITGISDIIRGQTAPTETATAQQIKGQYAGLRLRDMQQGVAVFATDLLRLKAQIICGFDAQTLSQIAAVDQLTPEDQELVPQALQMLTDKPLRNFRIEIAADSLVQIDEQEEKENRVEFLTAVGVFIEKAAAVGASAPQLVPLLMELLKFGVTGFKVGRPVEGVIDQALEQMKEQAKQPQVPVDPEQMKEQVEMQVRQEMEVDRMNGEQALAKKGADLDIREMKMNMQETMNMEKKKMEDQARAMQDEHKNKMGELGEKETSMNMQDDAIRLKGDLEGKLAAAEERIKASETIKSVQDSNQEDLKIAVQELIEAQTNTQQAIAALTQVVSSDRESELTVGPDGRKRARSRVVTRA